MKLIVFLWVTSQRKGKNKEQVCLLLPMVLPLLLSGTLLAGWSLGSSWPEESANFSRMTSPVIRDD